MKFIAVVNRMKLNLPPGVDAPPRDRRAGFSLLELLIALTILAIALVPVAYFYTKSLQQVEQHTITARAVMLAQERLAELKQMPYEFIRSNATPTQEQLGLYGASGAIDTWAADWYGYDYEQFGNWQAMFRYPLPLGFNPYQPQTQGYDNTKGIEHSTNYNPIAGVEDAQVNFNNGPGTPSLSYEYEPVGFYRFRVFNRNARLGPGDQADVRMADRRSLGYVEPSLRTGTDRFRMGLEQQVDNYAIYGRRTIILELSADPQDTDPDLGGADGFKPDDEMDGGPTAFDLYPLAKGPDNKFQMRAPAGSEGRLVIVEVFWLPRRAEDAYVPRDELNIIQLRALVSPSNEWTFLGSGGNALNWRSELDITSP